MNTDVIAEREIAMRVERARSAVMAQVEVDLPALTRRRRRHVGIAMAAAGLGAVALTAGTITVVQATQQQISYTALCYSAASTSSTSTTIAHPIATNLSTGQTSQQVVDPVASCAFMWRAGLVGQKPDPSRDPNTANFPVPQLVACTTANGVGAAFPRGASTGSAADFCDALGLKAWRN